MCSCGIEPSPVTSNVMVPHHAKPLLSTFSWIYFFVILSKLGSSSGLKSTWRGKRNLVPHMNKPRKAAGSTFMKKLCDTRKLFGLCILLPVATAPWGHTLLASRTFYIIKCSWISFNLIVGGEGRILTSQLWITHSLTCGWGPHVVGITKVGARKLERPRCLGS